MIWITLKCHILSMPLNCEKGRGTGVKSLKALREGRKIDGITAAETSRFGFCAHEKAARRLLFL
ncbi:hypothetical protein D8B20_13240 [Candidatus Pantoea soli]|uniref:Uncharacterized protein n=1 Tax=Candidatus Pantoea soli TaxID=3098669 RepID=A0A518XF93_9GAMM|nr:hypothetical protein D8B20_13240 [Pantoea soli]